MIKALILVLLMASSEHTIAEGDVWIDGLKMCVLLGTNEDDIRDGFRLVFSTRESNEEAVKQWHRKRIVVYGRRYWSDGEDIIAVKRIEPFKAR